MGKVRVCYWGSTEGMLPLVVLLRHERPISDHTKFENKIVKMSKQTSLSSFFAKPPPAKRAKTSSGSSSPSRAAAAAAQAPLVAALPAADGAHAAQIALLEKHSLTLPTSWMGVLAGEVRKPYFAKLLDFVAAERKKKTIFPVPADVFGAFDLCPLSKISVVIIGQDPYHGEGQGHGPCFSVRKGVKVPPSLRNIFKEAAADVGTVAKPGHGFLESWARQGVLLINTVLTVRKGEANSHKKRGWETFTQKVIDIVARVADSVVFLAWGRQALDRCKAISPRKHLVIASSHPSPLGAYKTKTPFFGSKCFSRTNEYLVGKGKEAIDWSIPV